MQKSIQLLPLLEKFISDSYKGRRLKSNGEKIKSQSIDNYKYVLKVLEDFSNDQDFELQIVILSGKNMRENKKAAIYWNRFYIKLSDYLVIRRKCHDNYVGNIFKYLKVFFGYLKNKKGMNIGEFYKEFYIRKEDIPVISILPDQLRFLIHDSSFEDKLPLKLKQTKDLFVFGCTVALRQSDLFALRYMDIRFNQGSYYLLNKSIKTGQQTKVRLPKYAVEIIFKNKKNVKPNSKIFANISKSQLNKNIRRIAELAGWTEYVGKHRNKNGKEIELKTKHGNKYRFCDLLSSHTMRRTAVTTMLMSGMTETVVKKISGHSASSRAFYRYVNFAQPYLDQEIDRMHSLLNT
jgi:site-specific recombinase XerD